MRLRLTVLRTSRAWSRAELARRARMAPSDVGKIESSRMVPYPSQLARLARALGMSPSQAATLMENAEFGHEGTEDSSEIARREGRS